MSDDRLLDEKIAGLVRSVERSVPPAVEEKTRTAASEVPLLAGIFARRWPRILVLVPGAAAVVLAAFLLFPLLKKPPAPPISEIRTEFEIVDKNIKIIFIQRPDFNLSKEE
jgi:hypothetical protein